MSRGVFPTDSDGDFRYFSVTWERNLSSSDIASLEFDAGSAEVQPPRSPTGVRRVLLSTLPTSSNEERDVFESYRLGANSYIIKPVQFDAFMETVAKIGLYWVVTNRAPQ